MTVKKVFQLDKDDWMTTFKTITELGDNSYFSFFVCLMFFS